MSLRIVRGVDAQIEDMVNEIRIQASLPFGDDAREEDEALEERLSEIRLKKDAYEIEEMIRASRSPRPASRTSFVSCPAPWSPPRRARH